jgi:ApaG protein
MYEEITRQIRVIVRPQFLENQSQPDEGKYVWAYTITLQNHSDESVKLLTRHWIIIDSLGHTQDIKGDGVVGEQPLLRPGEQFEYTSGCPLSTPSGVMRGSYRMITVKGEGFDVIIPAFSLDSPYDRHSVN